MDLHFMEPVKVPVFNERQPSHPIAFQLESPFHARMVVGRAPHPPLAQPLHRWPDAQCLAFAGFIPVRGRFVVLPASAHFPADHRCLAGRRSGQRAHRPGAVLWTGAGAGAVDQPDRAGGRSICQPAPAQPVRHADQHWPARADRLAGAASQSVTC